MSGPCTGSLPGRSQDRERARWQVSRESDRRVRRYWRSAACQPSEQGCLLLLVRLAVDGLAGQLIVDAPFRGEEQLDWLGGGGEPGLDALAGAGQFRCGLTAVLVGLAEQALAVDGVQGPSPQAAEGQAETGELVFLVVGHPQDDLGRGVVTGTVEYLPDPAQGPWPGLGELVLAEADDAGVVQVDGGLVGHEVAHQREAVQQP